MSGAPTIRESGAPVPDDLVQRLAEAHRGGPRIALAGLALPGTLNAAYAVQARLRAALGRDWAGWKGGAQAPGGPIRFGPLFAAQIGASPMTRPRHTFDFCGVEAEVAFVLGEAAETAGPAPDYRETLAMIASAHYAIEIVDSRLAGFPQVPRLAILADNQCGGALVLGQQIEDWRARDLSALPLSLWLDGAELAAPVGNPAGDPVHVLRLLAHHCARIGHPLRPGQVVTTGSCTGLRRVAGAGRVSLDAFGETRADLMLEAGQ